MSQVSRTSLPVGTPSPYLLLLRKINIKMFIPLVQARIRAAPGQWEQGVPSGRDAGHPDLGLGHVMPGPMEPQP